MKLNNDNFKRELTILFDEYLNYDETHLKNRKIDLIDNLTNFDFNFHLSTDKNIEEKNGFNVEFITNKLEGIFKEDKFIPLFSRIKDFNEEYNYKSKEFNDNQIEFLHKIVNLVIKHKQQ